MLNLNVDEVSQVSPRLTNAFGKQFDEFVEQRWPLVSRFEDVFLGRNFRLGVVGLVVAEQKRSELVKIVDLFHVLLVNGFSQIVPQEHQSVNRVSVSDFFVVLLSYQVLAVAEDVVTRRFRQLKRKLRVAFNDGMSVCFRVEDEALRRWARVHLVLVDHRPFARWQWKNPQTVPQQCKNLAAVNVNRRKRKSRENWLAWCVRWFTRWCLHRSDSVGINVVFQKVRANLFSSLTAENINFPAFLYNQNSIKNRSQLLSVSTHVVDKHSVVNSTLHWLNVRICGKRMSDVDI